MRLFVSEIILRNVSDTAIDLKLVGNYHNQAVFQTPREVVAKFQ